MSEEDTHYKPRKNHYAVDDPIALVHDQDLDIKANSIFMFGREEYILPDSEGEEPGIEFAIVNRLIKNINLIMRKNNDPILIHMKSCGGHWQEGMAAYDMIKACPNHITILNYTHARSMSSIIFQAADRRIMMPSSQFMYHTGTMAFEGTTKQFLNEARELEKTNNIMIDLYIESMKKTGRYKRRSKKWLRNYIVTEMDKSEEVYLTSNEAVDVGFADEVFGANGVYDWDSLYGVKDE